MAKTNLQKQRDFQHREKKVTQLAAGLFDDITPHIQDRLIQDMRFEVHADALGGVRINFNMDESTDAFLKTYAKTKGLSHDALICYLKRGIIARIRRSVRVKEVKMNRARRLTQPLPSEERGE